MIWVIGRGDSRMRGWGMMTSSISKARNGHGLESGIVYGPVVSRRFGRTFGINILPAGRKHCSFNCVYCQLGWTDRGYLPKRTEYPSVREIEEALRASLLMPEWRERPACLVISGNGEPTLHPDFEGAVQAIARFRDRELPGTPLISFTCGSELGKDSVMRALRLCGECHVKFDADAKRVDLPPRELDLNELLDRASTLENLVIQSCFTSGAIDNSRESAVSQWAEALAKMRPRRVDIYTIERATAAPGLKALALGRLREIAGVLKASGIKETRVFGEKRSIAENPAETR